jgi:Transposase IS116/IS110/IS902 family
VLDALAADDALPSAARALFEQMGNHIETVDQRVPAVDAQLEAVHKANPVSRLLAEIPGVGPLGAVTMALTVEPQNFASARHFAAWLGLTPKEHSLRNLSLPALLILPMRCLPPVARMRLIKIAARVVETASRVRVDITANWALWFQSATHHPLLASENATMTKSLLAAWCQPCYRTVHWSSICR